MTTQVCPACDGEGTVDGIELGACPETGAVDYERVPCAYCHGRGGFGRPMAEMAVVAFDDDGDTTDEAAQ